jgi:hypothetical protein
MGRFLLQWWKFCKVLHGCSTSDLGVGVDYRYRTCRREMLARFAEIDTSFARRIREMDCRGAFAPATCSRKPRQ